MSRLLWKPPKPSASIPCILQHWFACMRVCLNQNNTNHLNKFTVRKLRKCYMWTWFSWRLIYFYPKASAVRAQATIDEDPAAARLSLLQALRWPAPANFDATPITPAIMEKIRKNIVAPFPPKPIQYFAVSIWLRQNINRKTLKWKWENIYSLGWLVWPLMNLLRHQLANPTTIKYMIKLRNSKGAAMFLPTVAISFFLSQVDNQSKQLNTSFLFLQML